MTHSGTRPHIALYGNVAVKRGYCSNCSGYAFIVDGRFRCCGERAEGQLKGAKRMMEAPNLRKSPSKAEQRAIIAAQNQRCFYCELLFGSTVYRKARAFTLRICWDHVIPWVYGLDNRNQNFVAACQICNSLKSTVMFSSIEAARTFLNEKRKAKGYTQDRPMLELRRDV